MILAKHDEKNTLVDLWKNTKEITYAVQAGNLKEVIEKSKKSVNNGVTNEEKKGKYEDTLRIIEQIRKAKKDEAKLLDVTPSRSGVKIRESLSKI